MFHKSISGGIILFLLISSFNTVTSSYENTSNNSIQEMIDNANDGDTIYISSGVYYEHIILDKQLTIIGDGAETTIVNGMGLDEHIFNIASDDVEISGFTIMNCSIGFSGIRVNNDSCIIHHNTFRDCGGGVELWDVQKVVIHNNTIEENTWGVYVHNSINCSINNNNIIENVYGMELGFSSVLIKNNIFENNELYGVLQLWSNNVIIEGNTFENHENIGLQLYSSNENIINGNIVKDNDKGISFFDASSNLIIKNAIFANSEGIHYWFNSNKNQINNNHIYYNNKGIYLGQSSNNIVSSNNISNNTFQGIYLAYTSRNNVLQNNEINDNREGIYSISSSKNNISKNKIWNNKDSGIYLASSSNIKITDNNFNYSSIFIYGGDELFGTNWGEVKLNHWNTHIIENNTINNGQILYYKNSTNVIVPIDAKKIILANCSNSTIRNLNLTDLNNGIQIGYSSNVNITGNFISKNKYCGIYLTFSSNNILFQNNMTNNSDNTSYNIYLISSSDNKLIGNYIIGGLVGIATQYSSKNIITKNRISETNSNGIGLYSSSNNNSVFGNILNSAKYCFGITIMSSSNNTISMNKITKYFHGIHLNLGSHNNIIYDNNLRDNYFSGVYISHLSYENIIENNIIINCSSQSNSNGIILMLSSNNNSIYRNTIMKCNWGIALVDWTNNNVIKGNNLSKNNNGIGTSKTYNNIFSGNNISNNFEDGIASDLTYNNTFSGNNISNNIGNGIAFELSNNNIFSGNHISNNKFGLNINPDFKTSSDSNIVINNNFINNDCHIVFNHSFINFWFGNYWDDWNKPTPYPIYGEIKLERLDDRVIPWVQFDWKPAQEPHGILVS